MVLVGSLPLVLGWRDFYLVCGRNCPWLELDLRWPSTPASLASFAPAPGSSSAPGGAPRFQNLELFFFQLLMLDISEDCEAKQALSTGL